MKVDFHLRQPRFFSHGYLIYLYPLWRMSPAESEVAGKRDIIGFPTYRWYPATRRMCGKASLPKLPQFVPLPIHRR